MIYTRGRAHLDTVTLEISVGGPPEPSSSPVPQPPPPRLTAVQAVVTGRCNLSCGYCNVRLLGLDGKDMDRPTAERVVELAAEAPPDRVVMVTGGEPLLVPETTMWILQKVDPPKVLFTNGTLIDRPAAEGLRRLEVSPVVSMDGMADAHDPLRCGSWERAARGLDLLREAGVPYGISAVVRISARKTREPIPGTMSIPFFPIQPSPASKAKLRSRRGAESTQTRVLLPGNVSWIQAAGPRASRLSRRW